MRGRRGLAAEAMRRARRKEKRAADRRWKSRLLAQLAGPHDGRRAGNGAQHSSRAPGLSPERGEETEMHRAQEVGALRRYVGEAIKYGEELRLATLNVQSVCKPTMRLQLTQYMEEHGVGLLAIQETKAPQVTQYVIGNFLFAMAGASEGNREHAGVGFVIRSDVRRAVSGIAVGQEGRIVAVSLDIAHRALVVICCYSPQSARPEEERTAFFESLSEMMGRVERKHAMLLLGDFNARIHGRRSGEEQYIGPPVYGRGVQRPLGPERGHGEKTNRDLLMELCRVHSLCVMNTWFQKGNASKVTYVAPAAITGRRATLGSSLVRGARPGDGPAEMAERGQRRTLAYGGRYDD